MSRRRRSGRSLHQDSLAEPLPLPRHTNLPFFAYGLLKPGELAYGQIERFVDEEPIKSTVAGGLWVRDGLPLLSPGGEHTVRGRLVRFHAHRAAEAYRKICAFEPGNHYQWKEVTVLETRERAWALVGIEPSRASVYDHDGEWTVRKDPVLSEGLGVVLETTDRLAREDFPGGSYPFDWSWLFRLQMAYLFLWTIIERYAALSYGPTLEPGQKRTKLGEDPAFGRALKRMVNRTHRVYDSRNPGSYADLNPNQPGPSIRYYYFVRNNVTHRGKGAEKDGETMQRSLSELVEVFHSVLEERIRL